MAEISETEKAVAELNECKQKIDQILAEYEANIVPTFTIIGSEFKASYRYEKTVKKES